MRKIRGLRWARPAANPWSQPHVRGLKAKGLTFERRVARALPGAKHGLWFQFEDANGLGFCSPDLVLSLGSEAVILECKLTDCAEAREQLSGLYIPVLECILGRSPRGAVVARNLTRASWGRAETVRQGLVAQEIPLIHWLGTGQFPLGET